MTQGTVETLKFIKNLTDISWSFAEKELERKLCELGCKVIESVGHRKTFLLPNGLKANSYCEIDFSQIEIDLDVFLEADELDEAEYEKKLCEFQSRYEKTVSEAKSILGEPCFSGAFTDYNFPDDQDAINLTLWRQESVRFMVQLKHEGREIPMRVTFVITPMLEL